MAFVIFNEHILRNIIRLPRFYSQLGFFSNLAVSNCLVYFKPSVVDSQINFLSSHGLLLIYIHILGLSVTMLFCFKFLLSFTLGIRSKKEPHCLSQLYLYILF